MRKAANRTIMGTDMTLSPKTRNAALFAAMVLAAAAVIAFVNTGDPAIRVAFTLTNHNGATVTQEDLAGRHLLVFFGFTNCPDICPTQMSKLATVMGQLERSGQATEVTPVFISVDPERDNPEQVARFVTRFHDRFVGLTGARAAVTDAAASFKAYLHAAAPAGITDYQVVHGTTVYIVGPKGRIVDYVAGSEDVGAITARVQKALG